MDFDIFDLYAPQCYGASIFVYYLIFAGYMRKQKPGWGILYMVYIYVLFFQSHRSRSVLGVCVLDQVRASKHAALVAFLNAPTCLSATLCVIRYMLAHFLFQGQVRVETSSDSRCWVIYSFGGMAGHHGSPPGSLDV
jgi:hypothetical protein